MEARVTEVGADFQDASRKEWYTLLYMVVGGWFIKVYRSAVGKVSARH